MPPVDNRLPELTVVGAIVLHPPAAIIELSTDDVTIRDEFPQCDMPGVGIIVPMEEEEFTSC